jgi:dTDP-4-amino-4,6-dideoxygalactose transaminase
MMTTTQQPVYVTRPALPELAAVVERLQRIWDAQWLTNNGSQHRELEARLRERLTVPNLALFNNGTNALMAALSCVGVAGEVITTPFTFPATPHAIRIAGATPVFCDIDEETMNIDVRRIPDLITPATTAIAPVHVFGYPCDVAGIQRIADEHGLKVVYDAAHGFDVSVNDRAIGTFGDATMYSFHATKTFHTVEGGAVATGDRELHTRLERFRNFGIGPDEDVECTGFNGKLNEVQAAIGLAVFDLVDGEMANRRAITRLYGEILTDVEGITLPKLLPGDQGNGSHFVIRVDERRFGASRDELCDFLMERNVVARRYFSPLCSNLTAYRSERSAAPSALPVANRVSSQVLALPLYGSLPSATVLAIGEMIKRAHLTYRLRGRRRPTPTAGVTLAASNGLQPRTPALRSA